MRRILVVHDNELFLGQLGPALSAAGFEVVPCSSSMNAVALLDGPQPIDLVITRIGFERPPNGLSLAMMAKLKRRVPILFIANPKMAEHTTGIGEFLPASATPGEIVAAAEHILAP
jgi:DNA-binding response OmpR family regulator